MKTKIHTYTSAEPMLHVNAFVVEAAKELVIVDTTLTMSDSKALKKMADEIGKPIAGILLTHGHPDHVAGTHNLAPDGNVPIVALKSVQKLMADTEAQKHQQWSGMFGSEWIPRWTHPSQTVLDGDEVSLAGLRFQVVDLGSGGDCDANSIWLLNDETPAAFLGDFVYHQNHTYMADGSVLRWMANLERFSDLLKDYGTFYIGHGPSCDHTALANQQHYFQEYCGNVLKHTNGTGIFTEETKRKFEEAMLARYPSFGCQFMVALAADAVGKELASHSH